MAEHFDPTLCTWIGHQLGRGGAGQREVRTHVAEAYSLPLQVYYRATTWCRSAGSNPDWEPSEVIHDYLTDRLMRDGFMEQWQASGMRLRRWLINGLHFYLKERYRQFGHRGEIAGAAAVEFEDSGLEPGAESDRLMVRGLVREALRRTILELESQGRPGHARVFCAYYLHDRPIAELVITAGRTSGQIKGMLRLGRSRFRACFYTLLERDGLTPLRREEELVSLLELIA